MEHPDDLRYSEEHEWVRLDDDRAVVGITDYAQDALGDVVFVELPEPGTEVVRGARVCEIESTKSVSEVYAPVTGRIAAANDALVATPEHLNTDPYGAGWIFAMEGVAEGDLDALMDAAGYRSFVEQ